MDQPLSRTRLEDATLDGVVKGQPFGEVSCLAAPASVGQSILDGSLPLPQAVLKASALEQNSRWMRDFVARAGARIAPHVKTHMAPRIIRRQLADGAWGVTVATVQQFEVCRRIGARRILLANQLVGRAEIVHVAQCLTADPGLDFYCLVDSDAGLARLVSLWPAGAPRLSVLIELGYAGGRTGCRSVADAVALGQKIRASDKLRLAGVEGFEGQIASVEGVDAFLADMRAVYQSVCADQPGILTAGGSHYYDRVLAAFAGTGAEIVTRSGCYISHDHGGYAKRHAELCRQQGIEPGEGLRPALELWAYIQSRPEPGLAIAGFGKRDCGFDAGYPLPLWVQRGEEGPVPLAGAQIVALSDQHAHIRVPADLALQPGDRIGCGVQHPCTTFDKWAVLHLVDDEYRVQGVVRTCF